MSANDDNESCENIYAELPPSIAKNMSIEKIRSTPHLASNKMEQNNTKMKNMLFQSEKPFAQTFPAINLNLSRELTITPVNNVENIIFHLQKKLPQITIQVVQPSIGKNIFPKIVDTPRPNFVCGKDNLYAKQENKTLHNIKNNPKTLTGNPKRKITSTPLVKNKTISNIEDIKKRKQSLSCFKIPPKRKKLQQGTLNAAPLREMKTNLDNNLNKMSSIKEQNNDIVSTTLPLEHLIDSYIPKYDQFDQEISKPLEKTTSQLDVSQSSFEKDFFAEETIYENFDGKILEGDSTTQTIDKQI